MYKNNLYLYCVFAGFALMACTGYSLLKLQQGIPGSAPIKSAVKYHDLMDWSLLILGVLLFMGGGYLWYSKTYKVTKELHELNKQLTAMLDKEKISSR